MRSTPAYLRIFCDFDGIGDLLFRTFGTSRCEEIIRAYDEGRVEAKECWRSLCETVRNLSPEQLRAFARQQQLEPHFSSFLNFCREWSIPFILLSDGFDVYLEEILRAHGYDPGGEGERGVRYFANHLAFTPDGRIIPSFPYADEECTKCANCKRNHVLTMSADHDVIVYIGNGRSDFCPASYADVVFAKHALIGYCQSRNISFYEFQTLEDVQERLETLLAKKRLRKRWQAALRRRELFRMG